MRPHVGPSNDKLTLHMPLVVPEQAGSVRIRVADVTIPMEKHVPLCFDDSFEHEVWNDGDSERVTLWLFFKYPHLTSCRPNEHSLGSGDISGRNEGGQTYIEL